MVERLAAIHNDLGVHNDEAKADAEYAAAFRAYGVDLDRIEPEAAGRVLAASPAVADLANALDHWAFLRRGPDVARPGRRGEAGRGREGGRSRPVAEPAPGHARPDGGRPGAQAGRSWNGSPPRPTSTICRGRVSPGWPLRWRSSAGSDMAIALLRRAQASHRDDFWVNADLGRELLASGRPEEAVRFFAVAAGIRPRSGLALRGLAKALLLSGQPSEAADILREVTRLRPDDALSHVALGSALLTLGEPHEADAEFGEARRLKPDDWVVRDQIALALSDRGDWAAAVEEQRESVRRFPRLAVVHKALAHALEGAGRTRRRHRRIPRGRPPRTPLFRRPTSILGRALIEAGEFRAALEALAHIDPGPPPPDPKLSAVDAGVASRAPDRAGAAAARRREGTRPSRRRGNDRGIRPDRFSRPFYAAAARLWTDAFAASPTLAADPTAANRFQAARAAALAAAGTGRFEDPPDARSRARWREQAVGWLEADLAASAAVLESGTAPQQRAAVSKRLGRWQVDPALAGTPRCAGPGGNPRARATFAPRPLVPDRGVAGEGRSRRPRNRREQKSLRAAVTSGDISPMW